MARRRDIHRSGFVLVALLCGLGLALLAGPGHAKAHHHRDACRQWGNVLPQHLKPPQARKSIACFLNRERKRHGLSKVDVKRSLNHAAQRHTRYMRRHRCFEHECPGESSLESRLRHVDYLTGGLLSWTYGENIAWGGGRLGTPKEMVNAWMHSSGHRANILNGRFRDLGVGFERGSPSSRTSKAGTYTTDFGYRLFG